MTRRLACIAALSLVMAMGAGPSFAAEETPRARGGDGPRARTGEGPGPGAREGRGFAGIERPGLSPALMEQFDEDKDGALSKEEYAKMMDDLFDRADRNNDGKLEGPELRRLAMQLIGGPPVGGPGEGAGPTREGRGGPSAGGGMSAEVLLERFDSNGDGKLSVEEVPEWLQGMFERLDENNDGYLDKTELEAMRERMGSMRQRVGPQGDGDRPARDGARGGIGGGLSEWFAGLDKDGDGKLSKEELPEPMQERFDELDANKDGFVDMEELRAMRDLFGGREGRRPRGEGARQGPGGDRPARNVNS